MHEPTKPVFITGGTGYIGRRLINLLLKENYHVTALVRKDSEHKVPEGATTVVGNPFDPSSFQYYILPNTIFVQLLGVPHPSPKKAKQFREIDLKSVKASADAASQAGVSRFIYVSVAMSPSKLMQAYQEVRKEGEEYCLHKKLHCTFIRPWYVLGPGHWWPVLLLPLYGLAELIPSWRQQARAKSLVTIGQMLRALMTSIREESVHFKIYEIKHMRKIARVKTTPLTNVQDVQSLSKTELPSRSI